VQQNRSEINWSMKDPTLEVTMGFHRPQNAPSECTRIKHNYEWMKTTKKRDCRF